MKPDTQVWLLCESIGRPQDRLKMQCSAREAIKSLAEWLMGTYMGAKIRIIIARNESELTSNNRETEKQNIMTDLESILNGAIDEAKEESNGHSA